MTKWAQGKFREIRDVADFTFPAGEGALPREQVRHRLPRPPTSFTTTHLRCSTAEPSRLGPQRRRRRPRDGRVRVWRRHRRSVVVAGASGTIRVRQRDCVGQVAGHYEEGPGEARAVEERRVEDGIKIGDGGWKMEDCRCKIG